MLKKLLKIQLIGLALCWLYVGTEIILLPNRAAATEPVSRSFFRSDPELVFPVADHDASDIISVFCDPRGKNRKHQGVDIKAPRHTPVLAVTDGFVEKIREGGSGGRTLYLRSGDGLLYFYAHLEDWTVAEHEAVSAGQQIATVGDSGNARNTTPHLHFEILRGKEREALDPGPLLGIGE